MSTVEKRLTTGISSSARIPKGPFFALIHIYSLRLGLKGVPIQQL